MRRFERHHIGHRELAQSAPQGAILPVEGVGDHRSERDFLLESSLDQLQSDLELGAKLRIMLAFGKVHRWGIAVLC